MESQKRRVPEVDSVSHGGIRYEVLRGARAQGFAQNGGVIAAVEEASGRTMWTVVVYKTEFDPHEERDVQDVFITSLALSPDGTRLNVENERRQRFTVDLSDRSVTEVTGR